MKPGQPSRTAELVCMARALAHAAGVAGFSDPTALALLSEQGRARVERLLSGRPPERLRERFSDVYMRHNARILVARTVAIDEAVREAGAPQVVILGAGLDGRAWRMEALRDVVVFEVDHPDTQREKRARVAGLAQVAQEIRFVPVDFQRDALDDALTEAGHDPARATTWVWEGVVMYLSPAEVEATLAVIARRSAPGSRLVVLYHRPAPILRIVGFFVRRLGEPLRSRFTPEAMRALLGRHGFDATRDRGMDEIGAAVSADVGRATRRTGHMGLVTADRR